jgi:hypothetical protein
MAKPNSKKGTSERIEELAVESKRAGVKMNAHTKSHLALWPANRSFLNRRRIEAELRSEVRSEDEKKRSEQAAAAFRESWMLELAEREAARKA